MLRPALGGTFQDTALDEQTVAAVYQASARFGIQSLIKWLDYLWHTGATRGHEPRWPGLADRPCARICARDAAEQVETGETEQHGHEHMRPLAEATVHIGDCVEPERRASWCS